MEDRKLNEQQSIELIAQMINNTRNRIEHNAGMPFIVMGYTTVIMSVIIWYLCTHTQNYSWQFLWFVLPVVAISMGYMGFRKDRIKPITTYIDRIVNYIWQVSGIIVFTTSIVCTLLRISPFFIGILIMGMATALTGLVIRDRFAAAAGLLSAIAIAPISLIVRGIDGCLVFAAAFVVMMVIPGHVLNYRSNRANSHDSQQPS